jgi:hypothetical protein
MEDAPQKIYEVTLGSNVLFITCTRVEYMPTTGQTLFYKFDSLDHIVPKEAMVSLWKAAEKEDYKDFAL